MDALLLILQVLTLAGIAALALLLLKQRKQLLNLRSHQKELHEAIKRGRVHTTKVVNETGLREFRQVEALLALRDLVDLKEPLAGTRGWAASPDLLLQLARQIQSDKPRVILECGGGTSTVVMASLVRPYGGRVITLEHLPEFRDATLAHVAAQGLSDCVDVRLAPLTDLPELTFNGEHFRWYDPAALTDLPEIDLFFIDGPPESTGRYARYPALPLLWPHASERVKVLLDDTIRPDETAIAEAWAAQFGLQSATLPMEKGAVLLTR